MPKNKVLAENGYHDDPDVLVGNTQIKLHNPELDERPLAASSLSDIVSRYARSDLPNEYFDMSADHPMLQYAVKSEESLDAPPVYESHVRDTSHGSFWGNFSLSQHSYVGFRFTALRGDTHSLERVQVRIGFGHTGLRDDLRSTSNLSVERPADYQSIAHAFDFIQQFGQRSYNLFTCNCNTFAKEVAATMGFGDIQRLHDTTGPVGAYQNMQEYMEQNGNDNSEVEGLKFNTVEWNDYSNHDQSTRKRYQGFGVMGNHDLPTKSDDFRYSMERALDADKSIWKRLFSSGQINDLQSESETIANQLDQVQEAIDAQRLPDHRRAVALEQTRPIVQANRTLARHAGKRFPVTAEAALRTASQFERFAKIVSSNEDASEHKIHAISVDRIIGETLAPVLQNIERQTEAGASLPKAFSTQFANFAGSGASSQLGWLLLTACNPKSQESIANTIKSPQDNTLFKLEDQLNMMFFCLRNNRAIEALMQYAMTAHPLFADNPSMLTDVFLVSLYDAMEGVWKQYYKQAKGMDVLAQLKAGAVVSMRSANEGQRQAYKAQRADDPAWQTEDMERLQKKADDIETWLAEKARVCVAKMQAPQEQES